MSPEYNLQLALPHPLFHEVGRIERERLRLESFFKQVKEKSGGEKYYTIQVIGADKRRAIVTFDTVTVYGMPAEIVMLWPIVKEWQTDDKALFFVKDTRDNAENQLEFYATPLPSINVHPDFDVNVKNMEKVVTEAPQVLEKNRLWARKKVTAEQATWYVLNWQAEAKRRGD